MVYLVRVGRSDKYRLSIRRSPLYWPGVVQLTHTLYDFVHLGQIVPRSTALVLNLQHMPTTVSWVGWSLTSLFSTDTAISETKGEGWRVSLLPSEGRLAIY